MTHFFLHYFLIIHVKWKYFNSGVVDQADYVERNLYIFEKFSFGFLTKYLVHHFPHHQHFVNFAVHVEKCWYDLEIKALLDLLELENIFLAKEFEDDAKVINFQHFS